MKELPTSRVEIRKMLANSKPDEAACDELIARETAIVRANRQPKTGVPSKLPSRVREFYSFMDRTNHKGWAELR